MLKAKISYLAVGHMHVIIITRALRTQSQHNKDLIDAYLRDTVSHCPG